MSRVAHVFLAQDRAAGSWDRAAHWELGPGAALAFVADAPEKADPETGRWIERTLAAERDRVAKLLPDLDDDETALLAADLATKVGDALRERGGGRAYAACLFALAARGRGWFVAVGDCAAYVAPPGEVPVRRISDTTRVGGGTFLEPAGRARPEPYAEAVYLGAERRRFGPGDVVRLALPEGTLVALVSDGAEAQLGIEGILRRLGEGDLEARLSGELESATLVDDVTLLAFRVGAAEPDALSVLGAEVQRFRDDHEQRLVAAQGTLQSLERAATELTRRVEASSRTSAQELAALTARLDEQRDALAKVARELDRLRTRDDRGAERRLEARIDALEQKLRRAPAGAARPRERSTPASVPLGPTPVARRVGERFLPGGALGWVALAVALVAVAGLLLWQPARGWLREVWPSSTAAATAAPEAQGPRLVYLPPGASSGSPLVVRDEAALASLIAAGKPASSFVVPLDLARERWRDLKTWQWSSYVTPQGERLADIADRFVYPEEALRVRNDLAPGAAPGATVEVPAFHYLVAVSDEAAVRGVAERLRIDPDSLRRAWRSESSSGETLLRLPLLDNEPRALDADPAGSGG